METARFLSSALRELKSFRETVGSCRTAVYLKRVLTERFGQVRHIFDIPKLMKS